MKDNVRIIVALDFPNMQLADNLVQQLDPQRCKLKVGKELFVSAGPQYVETLVKKGFDVFLDLKFHDIPNTVARACVAAANLGVWMTNVHSLGGAVMMQTAREAIASMSERPLLIAVTILTSHSQNDLQSLGLPGSINDNVLRLAQSAQSAGLDGVVCSAQEAAMLRTQLVAEFKLVTPGIRLPDNSKDDQSRITTPHRAISDGADYLVIGRPITQAKSPMQAIAEIEQDLSTASVAQSM